MNKKSFIILIGCFDTKGTIFSYLYNRISRSTDFDILSIHCGVFEPAVDFKVDFDSELVARKGGGNISSLREKGNRGEAVDIMGSGSERVCLELAEQYSIAGIIGAGGGGGTYMVLKAMQKIPFGIPKLCVSTMAAKDLSRQVGTKDITLMSSVVDIALLNSIIQPILDQAASAIVAMSEEAVRAAGIIVGKKKVAISMFGNTTACVDYCTRLLSDEGLEAVSFHATGTGGKTMESLIADGRFDGIMDVTTTELADYLCGGVCDAGPHRLEAGVDMGLPQVIVPGCLDMVNFTYRDAVPDVYKNRVLYNWAPDVTLMRTNVDENRKLGAMMLEKLNRTSAPVTIVLPSGGLSELDKKGGVFYNPGANQALFDSIKENINSELIDCIELECHINDKEFAGKIVERFMELI